MTSYNWLDEFQAISTYYQKYKLLPFRKSIVALRSCIEADEPDMLYEITGSFRNACIFALILCFSSRPSVRCIQSLISQSVPLNESFTNNPFNCTPQEYLDTYFNNPESRQMNKTKAKTLILGAISKGNLGKQYSDKRVTSLAVKTAHYMVAPMAYHY